MRQQIWGNETFVDFEQGLNFAINKIRTTLGDDAETPRYIETLPRRGYRFIAPIEATPQPAAEVLAPTATRTRWPRVWLAFFACASLVALFVGFNGGGVRRRFWGKADPGAIRSLAVFRLDVQVTSFAAG
jgi:hypothetical protein